jgi:MFS family permease
VLIIVAVAAGMVRGILTLVQATAVTDRWGSTHYGQLTGVLSAPATLTSALAPWIGAALAAALGGYPAMFWVMAGIAAIAAVLGLASVPVHQGSGRDAVAGLQSNQ